jgi:hypothetical protein
MTVHRNSTEQPVVPGPRPTRSAFFSSLASPPTLNARSPAPVRTITPISRFHPAWWIASTHSAYVFARNAFMRCGRLNVIVATRPCSS